MSPVAARHDCADPVEEEPTMVVLVVLFAGIRRERRLRQERRTLARENARLTKDLGGAPVPGTLPAPGTVPAPAAVPAPDTAAWSAPPVTADEAASRPVVRPEPPADNRPQYDSPPPPSYDRATIEAEAERQQAAEDGAAVRDGDTTAPVDAPVDAPPAGRR